MAFSPQCLQLPCCETVTCPDCEVWDRPASPLLVKMLGAGPGCLGRVIVRPLTSPAGPAWLPRPPFVAARLARRLGLRLGQMGHTATLSDSEARLSGGFQWVLKAGSR
jgi:hypothetical protein